MAINFSNVTAVALGVEEVIQIEDSLGRVLWQKAQPVVADYFYIEDASGNGSTLSITKYGSAPSIKPYVSTDGTNWTSLGATSSTPVTASVPANGKLYIKCTTGRWAYSSWDVSENKTNRISVSDDFNIGGNIMSLLNGDNFENTSYTSSNPNAFAFVLWGQTHLLSSANLELPNNTTGYCYCSLFSGCTNLTAPPVLPATSVGVGSYQGMFQGCTSLTTAPVLNATTLDVAPYQSMFQGCTSLVNPPVLPATTVSQRQAYSGMFNGCTSLNKMYVYADTITGQNAISNWLQNVAATGDFYNYGSYTYTIDSPSGVPVGWTLHQPYAVSISAGSNGTVSVDGVTGDYSENVMSGTQLTLVATPDAGYQFDSWSDGDTNATRTVTITGNTTLTASFAVISQPNDELWYRTSDNQPISLTNLSFGNVSVVSNTYSDGKGVVKFSGALTSMSNSTTNSPSQYLTHIWFPDSLINVGQHSFIFCPIENLDLNNITTVGVGAFLGHHTEHIHIPATCTSIGYRSFRSPYTTSITVDANNPNYNDGSTHNGSNCIYQGTTLQTGCKNTVIPDNCTTIGGWALSECGMVSMNIPASVQTVGESSMDNNTNLTTLYVHSTPTFGYAPFYGTKTNGTLYYTSGVNYSTWLTKLPSGWTAVLLCDTTISAGSNGSVSVNGVSGNYHQSEVPSGTQLTLVATPDAGYEFTSWSDGNTNATRTVTITADTTLTASFVQQIPTYNVTITAGNNGTVSVNGVSGNYSQSVQSGTQLTIAATANNGYEFDEWSDNISTNPRTITITGNTTLTASFVQQIPSYSVSISAGNNGSVSVNGVSGNYSATVQSGTQLTLAATPNTGYQFDSWSDGDTNATRTVTITGNTTLTASFVQAQPVGEPFYIEDVSGSPNTVSIAWNRASSAAQSNEFFYSTDKINWTSMGTTSTTPITATVPANGKLYIKCTASGWSLGTAATGHIINCSGDYNVGGYVDSLLEGDNYECNTLVAGSGYWYHLHMLFKDDTHLLSAANLVMPTNTGSSCYANMFWNCTNLIAAPILPATTLAADCYQAMFQGCASLVQAPALPATTLAAGCYFYMFQYCTSLISAPVLSATTLADSCYLQMFRGCTSLNSVTTYADDISATGCLTNWLQNVAATGDFYALGSANWTIDSPSGVPVGWTLHHSLPVPCNVSISSNGNGTVSVNGVSGDYHQSELPSGTQLTLVATPAAGYQFDSWSDGDTNASRTIIVSGAVTLTASFVQAQPVGEPFYVEDVSISPVGLTLYIRKTRSSDPTIEVFSSTDGTNWSSMGTTSTTEITARVPRRGKLYLKATANRWGGVGNYGNTITASGNHNVGGNIMSLLNGDNFENTTLDNNYTRQFNRLFYNNTHLVDASDLELPNNVTNQCYQNMFQGCTSLTTAPALPATTMADTCYFNMFNGCTSLTTAPALPATSLAQGCYEDMFVNCSSLTTAPALPATTLANNCYRQMFYGCTSLTTAPALPATTLGDSCYTSMFQGCTSLTTAPALPATTLVDNCYSYMFSDCASLTTAPALPATTLAEYCYENMFQDCTSLTETPALPATTLAENCYDGMFQGCSSLNKVYTYADDNSASDCTNNWLENVAATGDFYNLGTATYTIDDPSGIPVDWTEYTSL